VAAAGAAAAAVAAAAAGAAAGDGGVAGAVAARLPMPRAAALPAAALEGLPQPAAKLGVPAELPVLLAAAGGGPGEGGATPALRGTEVRWTARC